MLQFDAAIAALARTQYGNFTLEQADGLGASPRKIRLKFAAMMVKDHSAANDKLKKLADSKSVKLPEGPSVTQKAQKKMLEMKSSSSFDKDYIEGQVKAHEETVELLKKEISSGKDADAKAFASEVLPTVEAHLTKINQIAADSGVKK